MAKISAVINTRNEEKNLPRAIASVKNFADEIVVVDMESTDKTVEVAKKYQARIFEHKYVGYVEPARNFAIKKASGDWILIIDADEELNPDLAAKLRKITESKKSKDFYRVARRNIVFGRWLKHSRWWPDYNIRFFKKGAVSWSEVIHSVPETRGKGFDLAAKESYAITHHHYESIEQFVERLNRYTTEHAKLRKKDGYKFSWKDLIRKPAEEFMSRYFFGQGYKDGVHGLAVSFLQAFSELVLYLKLWQMEKFKEQQLDLADVISEMRQTEKQMHYWQADALYKESGGLVSRIKRKFMLP